MGTRTPGKSSAAIDVREQGSLLRALFDMSFSRFLTLELIKLMYVATIIIVIVATVSSILFAFSNSVWVGIVSVLVAPFLALISVIGWRVSLELLIVLFRIAEYSREISENTSILGRRERPSDHPSR
jgi:hypothetical protein